MSGYTNEAEEKINSCIEKIRAGEIVIVVDDANRENEADLIMAGQFATPGKIAFFVKHTSGLICAAITKERADQLQLPLMVTNNTETHQTAFTVTVDYLPGTTTGISAADRAATIVALTNPDTSPQDLARPGHLHVLIQKEGGVLRRAGHTEAAVDLMKMAGLIPVGVLCEIVTEDGLAMAKGADLEKFAQEHNLVVISVADLIDYRRHREHFLKRAAEAQVPTPYGPFKCVTYENTLNGETHVAFIKGEIDGKEDVLVRVHSECLTGDVFDSKRCDCGAQLRTAMAKIDEEGCGVIVYLRGQEGRGIGLSHKLHAYKLQDEGLDTVEANVALGLPIDARDYGVGTHILRDLGITTMRLLTNNPSKRIGLESFGLHVTSLVPIQTEVTEENRRYLETKRDKMGHLITLE